MEVIYGHKWSKALSTSVRIVSKAGKLVWQHKAGVKWVDQRELTTHEELLLDTVLELEKEDDY